MAPGYVDFPPTIALLAALMGVLAGDSLFSIHMIPALASSAIIFLSALIALEFGASELELHELITDCKLPPESVKDVIVVEDPGLFNSKTK
jgi:hypothetical protein